MSAIRLVGVSKTYALYRHGFDRLAELVTGRSRHTEFPALHTLDLEVGEGEVLGLVGMNGAGKSTLLKVLAHTLHPTTGRVEVKGRVSALLELGTGFHPDMTGRENVYLAAAVIGIPRVEMDALFDQVVEFSGLGDFMNQPVKTYSSGMFVRLAFAVATTVDPDVLIVDEALSVGDGAFARKSFDRIMGFKRAGKTIVFCSHALYQVESICSRVVWMHHGRVMMDGPPADVIAAYNAFLIEQGGEGQEFAPASNASLPDSSAAVPKGHARFVAVKASAAGQAGKLIAMRSLQDDLVIEGHFISDPELPTPTVAFAILGPDGRPVCSAGSLNDGVALARRPDGRGVARLVFPAIPLLKGRYAVHAFLLTEDGVHSYDQAADVVELQVSQTGLEVGVVTIPHRWEVDELQEPTAYAPVAAAIPTRTAD